MMQRVLIIGGNGSGKTTMACTLAQRTGLPLVHLDKLYWTDNWVPRDRADFLALLTDELEKPAWILDGNMRRTLPQRLAYCDTVIYLDFPGWRCFWGVLCRLVRYSGRVRPDMGAGCVEQFDARAWRFLWSTLSFNRKNRDYFYQTLADFPQLELIVLKNRREVASFLNSLGE